MQPLEAPKSKWKRLLIILIPSFIILIAVVTCLGVLLPPRLHRGDTDRESKTHQGDDSLPNQGNGQSDKGVNPTIPHDGQCHVVNKVSYTFYGYPDNDPPGSAISEDCGRGTAAGGIGTFENPLTFATAPGEFERCELVYSPYIRKYLINEDYCESCTKHWKSHIWHVDVWLGGNSTTYAKEQLKCEADLTPQEESQIVIQRPSKNLPVDLTSFYLGGNTACRLDHVYRDYDAKDYC
ncbi:hypothetical protein BO71DRAFT_382200 [Aspergillus ellipticus CBS 707.79]|uniref:Uncharacterized protein n=1 Tax=Aspergillus ellipticus CBS 707.79 TaxID=1448320 RepID=A0A319DFW0_9EURO|nr:hypothetical protein BO71DRAFT_382200 [Aspergillus ellipticus CBS 707.79]